MVWLLLACAPGAGPFLTDGDFTVGQPQEPDDDDTTDDVPGATIVVPVAEQEVLLTVESPYEFYTMWDEAFADYDGDGFMDMLVDLDAPHDAGVIPHLQVIVRGPLEPGLSVPRDAWLVHDSDETYLSRAELTGDDQVDLVVQLDRYGSAFDTWIVPGPFDGNLTPGPTWIPFDPSWWGSWWWDVDLDGTRDLVVDTTWTEPYEVGALHVTWGPVSRWSGAPDVIVSPLCRDGAVSRYPGYGGIAVAGDVDGDGTPEASVGFFGLYEGISCGAFTVSLPRSGEIDPFGSPVAYDGLSLGGAADGDWTGDGLPEMRVDDDLLLSPITLSEDEVNASVTIDAGSGWEWFGMFDFDLGADGLPDAYGHWFGALVLFPADPSQITDPAIPRGWELRTFDRITTFLDQGHAWAAILEPETSVVRRIDLGSAR